MRVLFIPFYIFRGEFYSGVRHAPLKVSTTEDSVGFPLKVCGSSAFGLPHEAGAVVSLLSSFRRVCLVQIGRPPERTIEPTSGHLVLSLQLPRRCRLPSSVVMQLYEELGMRRRGKIDVPCMST